MKPYLYTNFYIGIVLLKKDVPLTDAKEATCENSDWSWVCVPADES